MSSQRERLQFTCNRDRIGAEWMVRDSSKESCAPLHQA